MKSQICTHLQFMILKYTYIKTITLQKQIKQMNLINFELYTL